MKKILFVLLISIIVFSCNSGKNKGDININVVENMAGIKFDNDVIDFKTLNSGEKVTGSFKFTNTGDHDLVISDVSANCGCTVADYPHDAIKPGKTGLITVTYDSQGAKGFRIQKIVTVLANTNPARTNLKIVADVQ
ncbi:MAG: DUF1573 domain-containing protein [Bacteroidales bacterium]|jgi:hypothetical protein|nr:DUF1573 domain-containing protein [Bacteroidales bacterium]